MATIEERAKKCANDWRTDEYFASVECHIEKALMEQDRIARDEERERCIKAAQDWLCKSCCETCYSKHNIAACYKGKAIRKAMEGGEV